MATKILRVKVKTNAKTQSIQRMDEGGLLVHLKSPPVDGKANAELIQLLAQEFNLARASIRIKSGLSSRHKLVEIDQR
ncbi:MAG TPA: DUF167 domain-containing protein [Chroococcidiopsis sp.]